MEAIKKLFKINLEIKYNKEKMKPFWITIITAMIVHFSLYALMITGADTLINSMYHQADVWESMLLRFGLDFVQGVKGYIVSPVIVTLISSILLGITVLLVINIFKINNKYYSYNICGSTKHISNFNIFLLFRCIYIRNAFSNTCCLYS